MAARRKKPVRARRVTTYRAWNADWASMFLLSDGWTAPEHVKIVRGKKGGTLSAVFLDEQDHPVEVFSRFRMTRDGEIEIIEQGLRKSYRWSFKAAAK
jgi:hypothetical protein